MARVIEVDAVYIHSTANAVLVETEMTAEAVWVPRSTVDMDPPEAIRGQDVILVIPERLAIEKGLV